MAGEKAHTHAAVFERQCISFELLMFPPIAARSVHYDWFKKNIFFDLILYNYTE